MQKDQMEMGQGARPSSKSMDAGSEAAAGVDIERVAREMGLASPAGASGLAYWMPAGMRLRDAIMAASLSMHVKRGYGQVKSPSLAPSWLFERSGHMDKYAGLMFSAKPQDGSGVESPLVLRPMSCPNHLSMFMERRRSVAELPWRVFEFGEVFRSEPSGSLSFLLRQRQFCQDDAHVVCQVGQAGDLAKGWLGMAREACALLGCGEPRLKLASRPKERIGSDELWDLSEGLLARELDASGSAWEWAPGDGAFYGPKIELALDDRLGRSWQMGVFQLDMNLPSRFGLRADGHPESEPLALVHHAVFGSIERAVGVLIACRGKELPDALHPNALAILPVSEKQEKAAKDYARQAEEILGQRVWLCGHDGPLGSKVARAKEGGWASVAVIGAKEAAAADGPNGLQALIGGKLMGAREACQRFICVGK